MQLLRRALSAVPEDSELNRLAGIAAMMIGRKQEAIRHLQKALDSDGANHVVAMTLGSVLFETGEYRDGLAHLQRACILAPEKPEVWYNYGSALEFLCAEHGVENHMHEARDALERAAACDPTHIRTRNKLTKVLTSLGETSAALAMVRGTLAVQPDCVDAWVLLGGLKSATITLEEVGKLQELLSRTDWNVDERVALAFTLAKALEDHSDYAGAFNTVSRANGLQRSLISWDREIERERVDLIKSAFNQPATPATESDQGQGVIFLICLPRSGATLVEQILASHPQVSAGGETKALIKVLHEESLRTNEPFPRWTTHADAEAWKRLGGKYLSLTERHRRKLHFLTDKSVDNWAYVGAALAMLPAARIVSVRRDPLETCFSCFRQMFPAGGNFTYELGDMASYYAGYERLMEHWHKLYPGRILDFSYESLQVDTEVQIRRLLAHCDLPFDPACLKPQEGRSPIFTMSSTQVREPIRKNTARSQRYGQMLDPLRSMLRKQGVNIGD